MARTARVVCVAVGLAMAVPVESRAQTEGRPVLTVQVYNYAGVARHVLGAAEREAARIYGAAGITVMWNHNPAPGPPPPGVVQVLLLSPQMEARKVRTDRLGDTVLGQASREARRAYLFWPRIQASLSRYGRTAGDFLGVVLAHEVGHLLLPEHGHSPTGIMQAGFDALTTTAAPRFTVEQGRSMRATLAPSQQQPAEPIQGLATTCSGGHASRDAIGAPC